MSRLINMISKYTNLLLIQHKILTVILMISMYSAQAQEEIQLYNNDIPNAKIESLKKEDIPLLYRYELKGAKKAVLIIPGGGYGMVAINHEGHDIAKAFNKEGYSAFVLYYRLPKDTNMVDRKIGPLQDAQRSMQYIRENYEFLQVGVIGFSAGGHLAATLSNHYDDLKIENFSKVSLRPDFSALIYPVISMEEEITHMGSKDNLIGREASRADVEYFSLEQQVDKQTPPSFLVHAADDKAVLISNTMAYIGALKAVSVNYEFFAYEKGGHGFGLINKSDSRSWADALFKWLEVLDN